MLLFDWAPDEITAILSQLTVDTVMVTVMSKRVADKCTNTEPWFGDTKWVLESVSSECADMWRAAVTSPSIPPHFHLPPPNDFIPSEFELVPVPANTDVNGTPVRTSLSQGAVTWHIADAMFKVPRSTINLQIVTPRLYVTRRNVSCCVDLSV